VGEIRLKKPIDCKRALFLQRALSMPISTPTSEESGEIGHRICIPIQPKFCCRCAIGFAANLRLYTRYSRNGGEEKLFAQVAGFDAPANSHTTEVLLQLDLVDCSKFAVVYQFPGDSRGRVRVSPGRAKSFFPGFIYNRKYAAEGRCRLQHICGCMLCGGGGGLDARGSRVALTRRSRASSGAGMHQIDGLVRLGSPCCGCGSGVDACYRLLQFGQVF